MTIDRFESSGRRRRSHRPLPGGALPLAARLCWLLFSALMMQAQTYTVLNTFSKVNDSSPYVGVTLDQAGNIYATTGFGGPLGKGTIYKLDAQGKKTILHSFWGGDGLTPSGTVLQDAAGAFYGVTDVGGAPEGGRCLHGCGAVYELDPTGKERVLYVFSGEDGCEPDGSLVRDPVGNLYGTTYTGGNEARDCQVGYGDGVVFRLDTNGKETVLHTFTGPPDGETPLGGLVSDPAGNLYGVSYGGSADGAGIVFKVSPGAQMTVLYRFTGGSDGGWPGGPLLRDAAGNLYGLATGGGEDVSSCDRGCGVVFKVDPAGKESVLYAFKGSPDGAYPRGTMVRDGSGSFYGITTAGGTENCPLYGTGCGIVFKLDADGNETVLYDFANGSGGNSPWAGLTVDEEGNLYGTTASGGDLSCDTYGCGVIFKLTP
jgi:uncharacterized repeat protein (TIGR03803 family)